MHRLSLGVACPTARLLSSDPLAGFDAGFRGSLTDPDGADQLLATAEQSIPIAAQLGIPRLNLSKRVR